MSGKTLFSIVVAWSVVSFESMAEEPRWEKVRLNSDQDLTAIHFADAQNGWLVGAFGTVMKTSDRGETWDTVKIPVRASFVSVFARGANDVFVARNGLNRTTDGGETWIEDIDGFSSRGSSIFDIAFISSDVGFLVQSGRIFRTTNGGSTWEDVSEFDGLFLDSIEIANTSTFFATGGITYIDIFDTRQEGNLARSRDSGKSWQAVTLEGIGEIHSSVWYDGRVGILFTFSGAAFNTEDGGGSWETLTDEMVDVAGTPVGIVTDAVLADDGLIVGVTFDGAIVESLGGDVWERKVDVGTPLVALAKTPDGTLFAAGNGGQLWKRSPGTGTPMSELGLRIESIARDRKAEMIAVRATGGREGRDYRLDSSLDLHTWHETEIQVALQSQFQFTVKEPDDDSYYRVVELPGE